MRQFLHDIYYNLRTLRRHWHFSVLIILCLALGIGANSAVFSVVNAVLLRPLPYENPNRLIIVLDSLNDEPYNVSPRRLVEFRQRSTSFTHLEAMETRYYNVTSGDSAERYPGGAVSAGLLDLLGVKPALGRTFLPEEDVPGAPRVAMISHALYQKRFGGDPNILDRPLHLDGDTYDIVGVLPPGAEKFFPRRFVVPSVDVWLPLQHDPHNPAQPDSHYLYVVGRLAEGKTLPDAQVEMKTIVGQLAQEQPDTNTGWGIKVMTVRQNWVGHTKPNLLMLFGAVVFVLLIACTNVSNLLLTRAAEQRGDMALRLAFGAKRWHLIRQFVSESVLLGLIGGAVGLVLSIITMRLMIQILPAKLHNQLRDLEIDYRVLLFTFGVSLIAGILPGLLAIWRVSSQDLVQQFSEAGQRLTTGIYGRYLRSGLVVLEIALTLVLLIGASLMIQSLGRLGNSETGFDTDNLLTLSISLSGTSYQEPEATTAFYAQVAEGLRRQPGVKSVGVTSVLPITRFPITTAFRVENLETEEAGDVTSSHFRRVDAQYFETLGIPVLEGRSFQASDDFASLPVAMVSEKLAKSFWPDGGPVGRRILRGRDMSSDNWLTIVGVVPEIQEGDMGVEIGGRGTLYVPYTQGARPTMYMVVRSGVEPTSLIPAVRQVVREVDPDQPIAEIETMNQRISASISDHRFEAIMLMIFSALSVVLALVGIYGLLSYSVSQRTQEMGMRMALGATGGDIVTLVLRQTLVLALIGLGAGLILALLLNGVLSSMLYEVEPTDLKTFVITFIVLFLTCAVAGLQPAWRAARCQPAVALRWE